MATVLYVDDEQSISRAVRAWLTRKGHEVHVASSLRAAKRCVKKYRFDGAFVDIWLGGDTGFDFLSWLQEHEPSLVARVVFITGDVVPERDVERRLETLGRPVLTKPFDLSDLETWVDVWAAGDRARARPDAGAADHVAP